MADETVETGIKNTVGFSISGAPLWLFKALVKESQEWYNNVYWPTIVGWYRDAMMYRTLLESKSIPQEDVGKTELPKEEEKKPEIKLFGGETAGKR